MNTNELIIRQLAEDMAECHYNSNVGRYVIMPVGQPALFSELSQAGKEICIKVMTPVAESIAEKLGANAFKAGFFFCKQYYQLEENHSDAFVVEEEQIKMGFIPQEGGKHD